MIVKTKLSGKVVQGDKLVLEFSVYDDDENELSLTGKTIEWTARNSLTKKQVLSKSTVSGITILDVPDDFKFKVEVLSAETASLIGNHDHEAVIKEGIEKLTIKNTDNTFGVINFREKV